MTKDTTPRDDSLDHGEPCEPQKKILEPVLNNNTPKWLSVTTKLEFNEDHRPAEEIIKNPLPPIEKKVFTILEPNRYQCKKCGCMFTGGPKEPLECPEHLGGCGRASSFTKITKDINLHRWKLPYWKDIPVEDLDMLGTYTRMVDLVKQCIIFPEERHYEIFVLWIIASYKLECFNTLPFLIFRGLVESGKTRALHLIQEMGHRMILCSAVTFAAMVRYTHYHQAGLLLDEIDSKINIKTEKGQETLDFIKPSYKRGQRYSVAHKDDQEETMEYKNFGFKAFAGERGGYDKAIDSRSIKFYMEQDYPDILNLKRVQKDFDDIQTILINYKYKTSDVPELPDDFPLIGRDREIFECILRIAMHIGLDTKGIMEFIKERKEELRIDQQESREYILLKAIRELSSGAPNRETLGDDAPEILAYSDIADHVGWEDKQRQRIGYLFKRLGLRTKRMNSGSVLILNNEKNSRKLTSLYRRFHL